MLVSLTIENFGSIADAQTLDLRIPETTPDLDGFARIGVGKPIRVPRVVGIFGPNASGKTTVLRALQSAIRFMALSFELQPEQSVHYFPSFAAMVSHNKLPSAVSMEWISAKSSDDFCHLRYEIGIAEQQKIAIRSVAFERLSIKNGGRWSYLFKRDKESIESSGDFDLKAKDPRFSMVRSNASVISTLAKFNHKLSTELQRNLRYQFRSTLMRDDSRNNDLLLPDFFFDRPSALDQLNRDIQKIDLGIDSVSISPLAPRTILEMGGLPEESRLVFDHEGFERSLKFDEESHGTQRFIALFPDIFLALQSGQVAFIDEIDSDLHPAILAEIIRWFQSPERNPKNAQLIFTAHNATILDRLEKEEVVFTEKSRNGRTRVFKAADIRGLRRDPSLMRKYLSGALGALPQIG